MCVKLKAAAQEVLPRAAAFCVKISGKTAAACSAAKEAFLKLGDNPSQDSVTGFADA